MPARVGIDIVDVDEVHEAVGRWGNRYVSRVFTDAEIGECSGPGGVEHRGLAARFAAKEAVLKVLRPGRESVPWRTIEVRRDASGGLSVRLTGAAHRLAQRAAIECVSLSVACTEANAIAIVVAQSRE